MNDLDASGGGRKRVKVLVAGVVRKSVLYKLLPKEGVYVAAQDWAVEFERSEVRNPPIRDRITACC